jgi:hypothetical protein
LLQVKLDTEITQPSLNLGLPVLTLSDGNSLQVVTKHGRQAVPHRGELPDQVLSESVRSGAIKRRAIRCTIELSKQEAPARDTLRLLPCDHG